MNLRPKHHRGEDEEEETFKAQEDEKDDCCWRREGTALWGKEGQGGGCGGQKKMEAWRSATVANTTTATIPPSTGGPTATLQSEVRQNQAVCELGSEVYLFIWHCINIWMSRNFYKLMKACVNLSDDWTNDRSRTVRNEGGHSESLKIDSLVQSSSKQFRKWKTTMTSAWREMSAMYIWKKIQNKDPISTWKLTSFHVSL